MDSKKILLDLDCVLANTTRHMLKYSKEKFNLGPGDVPYTFDQYEVSTVSGLSEEQTLTMFNDPNFWKTIPAFKGASTFSLILYGMSHLHIVTDRRFYANLIKETDQWLYENNISFDALKAVAGKKKWEYVRDHGIVLAIEDNPHNAKTISNYCPVILLEWGYNRNSIDLDGLYPIIVVDTYMNALKAAIQFLYKDTPLDRPLFTE